MMEALMEILNYQIFDCGFRLLHLALVSYTVLLVLHLLKEYAIEREKEKGPLSEPLNMINSQKKENNA